MSVKVGAQLVARHSTPPSLMLEAPSADQLERMMSLEPIAQVLLTTHVWTFLQSSNAATQQR